MMHDNTERHVQSLRFTTALYIACNEESAGVSHGIAKCLPPVLLDARGAQASETVLINGILPGEK
jgi:hypothetical protein